MPFSFIEIEEKKSKLVILVFLMLILFYFFVAWTLIIPLNIFFISRMSSKIIILPTLPQASIALLVAATLAIIHWFVSINNVVGKTLIQIGALPVDEKDSFHRKFKNIIEEASIAAGGKKVEACVIPNAAVNAFALSDFNNRNVIGVTEGLLAKLNRSQLEAVVAHEFGHILNGDSRMATVVSAMFNIYATMLEGIKNIFKSGGSRTRRGYGYRSRGKGSGQIILFLMMIYAILSVANFMSRLLNMFLSRQREYRADAISARLTRNPLALAEALHVISRGWRGGTLASEHMSNIFIINPMYQKMDETESFFANMLSTHPPVKRRIDVMLDMAHGDAQSMIKTIKQKREKQQRVDSAVISLSEKDDQWFAVDPGGDWQGPFDFPGLKALPWFNAETWIRAGENSKIKYAWQETKIRNELQADSAQSKSNTCPRCQVMLNEVLYEGVPLKHCASCGGNLLKQFKLSRVFTRQQQGFSPEVKKMAEIIRKSAKGQKYDKRKNPFKTIHIFNCPECAAKMQRKFYNYDYPVEVDLCARCDIIWFDKNELEVLQLLYEQDANKRDELFEA